MGCLIEDAVHRLHRQAVVLGLGGHQGTDVGAANIGLAGSNLGDGIGRATAAGDAHFQAFVLEEAFLNAHVDRGLVPTRQPVQLVGHLVGGQGGLTDQPASQ